MKKLSTLLILAMLAPAVSYAQTTTSDCIVQPSCSELGYTQTASTCSGKYIACPFDTNKVLCINAAPKVGDLKYSLNLSNHDGWLRCDGSQYSQTEYKKLYNVIKTNFCRTYSSRTSAGTKTKKVNGKTEPVCESGKFAVPDYRGFLLRGYRVSNSKAVDAHPKHSSISNALYYKGSYLRYGASSGSAYDSLYIPEFERLPNLTGAFEAADNVMKNTKDSPIFINASGSFQLSTRGPRNQALIGLNELLLYSVDDKIVFDASRSNEIYDGAHVVPANYSAHIFIYAGDPE